MVALTPFILLASAIGVYASPPQIGWVENYALLKRDTSFPATISTSCVPFIIGQTSGTGGTAYGQVCVTVNYSTHTLTVTYPTNPGGNLYTDEHVWVGCKPPTGIACTGNSPPANCDNSDTPGHFPFSKSGGQCTQSADGKDASCTFNIDTILKGCDSCDQSFYIIAHASVTSGTGVGKGTSYASSPWWKQYWSPTFICLCTSTITYPAVTYSYTLESTTTVTSTSTTSYVTTSTTVLTITTTSSSIYSTTEYSTTTYTSTSTTTSLSESTPITTSTSTCHLS